MKKPREKMESAADDPEFEAFFGGFMRSGSGAPADNETPAPKSTPDDSASEQQEESDDDSDRDTPLISEPTPKKEVAAPDSQRATKPAPDVNVSELFALSGGSSYSPSNVVVQQVRDVAAVIVGEHPGLKVSPVPRMYIDGKPAKTVEVPAEPPVMVAPPEATEFVPPLEESGLRVGPEAEPDPAPRIEITGSEEVDEAKFLASELTLEDVKKKLEQCLYLYKEMHIDFSSVFAEALCYKWDNQYLTSTQVQYVIHYFIKLITQHLSKHLLEGQTNIVQTKTGQLAGRILRKIAEVKRGELLCAEITLVRFRKIKELVEEIPSDLQIEPIAGDFIKKLDFKDVLDV